jgi:hypothetical protein
MAMISRVRNIDSLVPLTLICIEHELSPQNNTTTLELVFFKKNNESLYKYHEPIVTEMVLTTTMNVIPASRLPANLNMKKRRNGKP